MGPKAKTHRGAAKRFKVTGRGKVLRSSAGRRHLLGDKAPGRKRSLRGNKLVHKNDERNVKALLQK